MKERWKALFWATVVSYFAHPYVFEYLGWSWIDHPFSIFPLVTGVLVTILMRRHFLAHLASLFFGLCIGYLPALFYYFENKYNFGSTLGFTWFVGYVIIYHFAVKDHSHSSSSRYYHKDPDERKRLAEENARFARQNKEWNLAHQYDEEAGWNSMDSHIEDDRYGRDYD